MVLVLRMVPNNPMSRFCPLRWCFQMFRNKIQSPKFTRSGFTLVEFVAATALTMLLILAVLMVVCSAARGREALASAQRRLSVPERALQLIDQDLLNSDIVRIEGNTIRLDGHASLNLDTPARRHRPVRVEYTLRTYEGRSWLVRSQKEMDDSVNRKTHSELVCANITGISMENLKSDSTSSNIPVNLVRGVQKDESSHSWKLILECANGADRVERVYLAGEGATHG